MYWFSQHLQQPLHISEQPFVYTLSPGSSFSTLVNDLHREGVLRYPRLIKVYGRLSGLANKIKAGEYALEQGTTLKQLFEQVKQGRVLSYEVTLVEGWRFSQLLSYLKNQKKLSHELEGSPWPSIIQKEFGYTSLEGLIFPDTYRYVAGSSDLQILKQAFARMQNILQQEWQKREQGLPYDTPYQALIMASLIERETGVASEREQIAGVFVRRLRKRMRLQTDPTVIYGLGESFDGNLRSSHLKDSANLYNTYRHGGLPPTPIAMAGREAIYAALHPAKGKSLYFVAKGDGSHYFSASLAEHNKAVQRYQVFKRRKDYRSAPKK